MRSSAIDVLRRLLPQRAGERAKELLDVYRASRAARGLPSTNRAVLGAIQGSAARDGLEAFALGDLPGISVVLVDGEPLVAGRSEQTPPARVPAVVRRG